MFTWQFVLRYLVPAVLASAAFCVPAANAGPSAASATSFRQLCERRVAGLRAVARLRELPPRAERQLRVRLQRLVALGRRRRRRGQRALPSDRLALPLAAERQLGAEPDRLSRHEAAVHPLLRERPRRHRQRPAGARLLVRTPESAAGPLGLRGRSRRAAVGRRRPDQLERRPARPASGRRALSSSSARIEITPLGSGSRWQIDDLYIDPCDAVG